MRKFLHLGLVVVLLMVPAIDISAQERFRIDPEVRRQIVPEEVGPAAVYANLFPFSISGVAGFDSTLVVSSLRSVSQIIDVCGVRAGATTFTCNAITFGPLETKFLGMQELGVGGTTGQIWVLARVNFLAMDSLLFIFEQQGLSFSIIRPFTGSV